ncbi:MAG: sigma 54-interacting transcriptional regulator [Candidatus Brocadiia bacterium]
MEKGNHSDTGQVKQINGLIVIKDVDLRKQLVSLVENSCQDVYEAGDSETALDTLAERKPHLLVVDATEEDIEAMRLVRVVSSSLRNSKSLVLIDAEDTASAIKATKLGAFDCLPKPFEASGFRQSLEMAAKEIVRENHRQTPGVAKRWADGRAMVGKSDAMKDIWEKVQRVKDVTSNVLIQGDTGTGKELVARAIHDTSPRSDGPFVKLNCGAIPKDLLESELFGHEKGSFTGALQQRMGRFEMADGGTLLLDEIGDMPLELQVKLLGVLQDRFVQRVGGHEKIPVDVRIIAATHQDLPNAIEENRFRQDLYYRLNVIPINVPPLRERKEDIQLLVDHFIKMYRKQTGRNVEGITEEARRILMHYDYPGNIRELENIVESAVVLCSGDTISAKELPHYLGGEETAKISVKPLVGKSLEEVERLLILETLRYVEGNKRQAAEILGITPRSIYRKLNRYEIPLDSVTT